MKEEVNVTNLIDFELSLTEETQIYLDESNAIVANSLRIIILEFFMKASSSFVIVLSCRRKRQYNFFLNILEQLFEMVDDMNVQIVCVDYQMLERIEGKRMYNLLLIDSFESFLDIDVISYTKDYDANEYYHIFLMQDDDYLFRDMENIFAYCWNNQIINCNIQFLNSQDELEIYTYLPFGINHCGDTRPKFINQFINNDWWHRPFFLPKTNNFYGCSLVGMIRSSPPYAFTIKGQSDKYSGFEAVMVSEISRILNFTLVLREAPQDDRYYPASNGALFMLANRAANFAFGYYRRRPNGSHLYTTTVPHHQSSVLGAICVRAHLLTPFQVLSYPFQVPTWIAVLASTIVIFVVTRIIHSKRPKSIAPFSMLTCAFGFPIKEKPKKLHSYLMFSPWLWCTFLLRSIYSGLLYHFFSNNIYQAMPKSLEAARNQSYSSVMNSFTDFDISDIPYYGRANSKGAVNVILNSTSEFGVLEYLEKHTDENIFAVIAQEFLTYYTVNQSKVGLFHVMPESVMQQQLCIYFTKHTILAEPFDLILSNLKSMGLMRLWIKRFFDLKVLSRGSEEDNKMIRHQDLFGVYVIWGGSLILGSIVFILEILSLRVDKLKMLFD
ncbi:uncharacterized protein LOC142231333 [Haematobia irritans]|uniref:uncharacterized protein LOC142231333 n=1 Tax=Haematobia irritans TaxID=7368 RepID=UPI003F4F8029